MQVKNEVKLSEVLWYKIGGNCKYFLDCRNKNDIIEAVNFIKNNKIDKVFICGLGSNLIFTDDYFNGAVIRISKENRVSNQINLVEKNGLVLIDAFAGLFLDDLITYSFKNNFTGLEWAGGLPGTIGAAVRGNVGAYGGEIKDSLYEAEILTIKNGDYEIKKYSNSELKFSYRHSLIKEKRDNMIILSASFKLKQSNTDEIIRAKEIYRLHIQQRKDRHPLEFPNCGSVFKNIRESEKILKVLEIYPSLKEKIDTLWYGKVASGYLIQKLGLQGLKMGNAQISEKHALFIVNLGNAKAEDVLTIISVIQNKIKETFGFTLDIEVEIVS